MRLTDDSPTVDVLKMARTLAARYRPCGALERGDYVGAACLAFYARTDGSRGPNFHAYMLRRMDGAILDLLRRESRHQLGTLRSARPSVQGFASPKPGPPTTGESASPHKTPLVRRHRRRAGRQAHNQMYYFQHYEKHARRDYARHCQSFGASALPYDVWRERRELHRKFFVIHDQEVA